MEVLCWIETMSLNDKRLQFCAGSASLWIETMNLKLRLDLLHSTKQLLVQAVSLVIIHRHTHALPSLVLS